MGACYPGAQRSELENLLRPDPRIISQYTAGLDLETFGFWNHWRGRETQRPPPCFPSNHRPLRTENEALETESEYVAQYLGAIVNMEA